MLYRCADVVTAELGTGDFHIFEQTAEGFSAVAFLQGRNNPRDVETGDVDGDGRPDIVAVSQLDGLSRGRERECVCVCVRVCVCVSVVWSGGVGGS